MFISLQGYNPRSNFQARLFQLSNIFGGQIFSMGAVQGAQVERIQLVIHGISAYEFAARMLPWCVSKRSQLKLIVRFSHANRNERLALRQELVAVKAGPNLPLHFSSWQQFGGYMDTQCSICIDAIGNLQLRSDDKSQQRVDAIMIFLTKENMPCGRLAHCSKSWTWFCSRRQDIIVLLQHLAPYVVQSKPKFDAILSQCHGEHLSLASRLSARKILFDLNGAHSLFSRCDHRYGELKLAHKKVYNMLRTRNGDISVLRDEMALIESKMREHKLYSETLTLYSFIRRKLSDGASISN